MKPDEYNVQGRLICVMKEYLGDGVYMEFDGVDIILTTEDGISIQNRIVLEPSLWQALIDFIQSRIAEQEG